MELSYDSLRLAIEVCSVALSAGVAILLLKLRVMFVLRSDYDQWMAAHAEAHREIDRRLAVGNTEFAELKVKLSDVATVGHVYDLITNLTRVEGEIKRLETRMDGSQEVFLRSERQIGVIHDHLLNRGHL